MIMIPAAQRKAETTFFDAWATAFQATTLIAWASEAVGADPAWASLLPIARAATERTWQAREEYLVSRGLIPPLAGAESGKKEDDK